MMSVEEACRYQCLCGGILLEDGDQFVCRECGALYCSECGGQVIVQGRCVVCLSCGASVCGG